MHLITLADAASRKTKAKISFSRREAVVGFFVVGGYGAGITWMLLETEIPRFIVAINVALWMFFFVYWQGNLRRSLGGHRLFALAASQRALLFPLNHLDRKVPADLDLFVELPLVEVRKATFVDLRTVYRHKTPGGAGGESTTNLPIGVLRLELDRPIPDEVPAALKRIQLLDGFQGAHVHIAESDVLEVFFLRSQEAVIARLLQGLDSRLAPTGEQAVINLHLDDCDDASFDAATRRLESAGQGMAVKRARAFRAQRRD